MRNVPLNFEVEFSSLKGFGLALVGTSIPVEDLKGKWDKFSNSKRYDDNPIYGVKYIFCTSCNMDVE